MREALMFAIGWIVTFCPYGITRFDTVVANPHTQLIIILMNSKIPSIRLHRCPRHVLPHARRHRPRALSESEESHHKEPPHSESARAHAREAMAGRSPRI